MDQQQAYDENSAEQYMENDYSQQWRQVRPSELKTSEGMPLSVLGIPNRLFFGEKAYPWAILESLINLDKQYFFAHKYPDVWFTINQNLRADLINNLLSAIWELFPELKSTQQNGYATHRSYSRFGKTPSLFDKRDGAKARHVEALKDLMSLFNAIFRESIAFDPNNILAADLFLQSFYTKLSNYIPTQQATEATKTASLQLTHTLGGGRMADYKNLFVPCGVVMHDLWKSEHFEDGSIPPNSYFAAYNNPFSTGEADQGAYNLLSMQAGGRIRRHYGHENQADFESIIIQDPPNLTNGYYIRLPIKITSEDDFEFRIKNIFIVWIPGNSLGRVNPQSIMDEDCFITTTNSNGELIMLDADLTKPVGKVKAYPPLTASAAEYLGASDELTSHTPFDSRRNT